MKQNNDFKFLDNISDLEFLAWGDCLESCFENAAKALISSITDIDSIDNKIKKNFQLSAGALDVLMHDWLNEILFSFSVDEIIFVKFELQINGSEPEGYTLSATASGENINNNEHEIFTEIKAVTYHNLYVKNVDGVWEARVLCDT